jgi:hypothetical protein
MVSLMVDATEQKEIALVASSVDSMEYELVEWMVIWKVILSDVNWVERKVGVLVEKMAVLLVDSMVDRKVAL